MDQKKFASPHRLRISCLLTMFIVCAAIFTSIFVGRFTNLLGSVPGTIFQTQVAPMMTFTPGVIPVSGPELGNPLRGAQYASDEAPPPNWPQSDGYRRWCWKMIEPAMGQYNFALIDSMLARYSRYTFGWRIMPVNPNSGPSCVPQYLMNLMHRGFYSGTTYVPDYNDPIYLARAKALFTVLGQRYDHNPRVGLLDMSLYGCWGEWNDSCIQYPSPTGAVPMTAANKKALIDMQFQAFPHKRFLMLTDDQAALNYALSAPRLLRTGVRIDCLGTPTLGDARGNLDHNMLENRQWSVAPLYFEYCANPNFALALGDIKKYHASLIGDGDGNLAPFGAYGPVDQSLLIQGFKAAGYRFALNSLTIPQHITVGTTFSVTTSWTNMNAAPAYTPWRVMIELRTASNALAWQGQSQLNLQQPFNAISAGNDTRIVRDTFVLPQNLPGGNYKLLVRVLDAQNVYPPLALSNQGRLPDGSYLLGAVSIISPLKSLHIV